MIVMMVDAYGQTSTLSDSTYAFSTRFPCRRRGAFWREVGQLLRVCLLPVVYVYIYIYIYIHVYMYMLMCMYIEMSRQFRLGSGIFSKPDLLLPAVLKGATYGGTEINLFQKLR